MARSTRSTGANLGSAAFIAALAYGSLEAPAHATVPDMYGAGGRLIAMGGGGVAIVDDGAAALVNPAGLFQIRRPTVSLGLSGAYDHFDAVPDLYWDTNRDGVIDANDPPLHYSAAVDNAVGLHFSAGRNIGGKFALGVNGYVPTARLLRFSTFEPDLPTYVMYANRPQRYAFAVGIGGQPVKGLAVGAGIDFVPRARYTLAMTLDATLTGTTNPDGSVSDLLGDVTVDVHQMDLDLVPGYAPIVGVQLDLGKYAKSLDGVWLAANYRGSVGLPITVAIDLQTNIHVRDVGSMDPFVFAAILDAALSLYDHYVPATLTIGAAYRSEKTLTAYVDVRRTMWSHMRLNVAKLVSADITSPLIDVNDLVHDGNDYTVDLRDTLGIRSGAEIWLPKWTLQSKLRYVRLFARGGFQYEPTPLVSQGPSSAFLDADRFGVGMGVGFETWDPFALVDGPVRLDAFAQHDVLASTLLPRTTDTPRSGYPIDAPGIPVGGSIWVVGAQWGFDY